MIRKIQVLIVICFLFLIGCNSNQPGNSNQPVVSYTYIPINQEVFLSSINLTTLICDHGVIDLQKSPTNYDKIIELDGCAGIKAKATQKATIKSEIMYYEVELKDGAKGWVEAEYVLEEPICTYNIDCSAKIKQETFCSKNYEKCDFKIIYPIGGEIYYKYTGLKKNECSEGVCIECTRDPDCSSRNRICDEINNECVPCLTDSDCKEIDPTKPLCHHYLDPRVGTYCAECLSDSDCRQGETCYKNHCEN